MIVTLLTRSAKSFVVAISGVVTAGAVLSSAVAGLPGAPFAAHLVQESGLAALIEQLDAPDARERAMAACRIGQMPRTEVSGVSAARDALLRLLGDDTPVESRLCREYGDWFGGRQRDSSPGREAAIALERVGEEALDALLELLRGAPPVAREHAALALGLLESSAALDGLVAALDDDDVDAVRGRAAWSLGMLESSAAIGPLGRALEDRSAAVREQAAWALGMIEAEGAVEALGRALQDDVAAVREQSAWALGMIEAGSAVEVLTGALRDDDAEVREQAAWALGMIEDAAAVDPLVAALRDDEADVREQVAWALGMIESSAAVPGLVEALRDPDAEVRKQAAWALGMIEDPAAVEALLAALEDDDVGVRKQVLWALMQCVDDDAELDYEMLAEKLRKALIGG